jgi:O-antigen/teichoic acid export membrane protein
VKVNQIKAGALLSYVSMGLSTLISLVYTPIMIQRLGDSEFGVYQAVLPIISYLNLLSFGLGSAYVRYYSRYKTAKDKKGMAMLNGMFLTTYLVLGALVLAIGWGLSYCDAIFGKKLTAEEIVLAERLLRILSLNAALTFPISVFESHVTINEQYLFQKIVGMGKQVLNPLIMIPLLIIGYRSVTLTIVSLVFTIVSGIVNITFCLTRLRMPFSFRRYDFGLLREMVGFTFYVFLGIVVDNFNWSIDRLLLTWLHGSVAVAVYAVAAQLNTFYLAFSNAISNVMTPRVHRLVTAGAPMRKLDALFTRVGRLQFILLAGIFWGFVAIGQRFVVLWGGGPEKAIDYWTTLLLFFATLWTNIQTVGIEIQRAMNKHKFRSVVYLAVALSNAVISIPLCIRWQGFGAAIGTTLATFVGNVLLMNWYYHHRIGLNIPAFWRHIFHLFPATVLPAAVSVALAVFVHPQTYFDMILPAAAVVAVYGGSMWLFGMNRYERELIAGPVRRILKRLHR